MKFTKLFAVAAVAGSMMTGNVVRADQNEGTTAANATAAFNDIFSLIYSTGTLTKAFGGTVLSDFSDWIDIECAGSITGDTETGDFRFKSGADAVKCLSKLKPEGDSFTNKNGTKVSFNVKAPMATAVKFLCTANRFHHTCSDQWTQAACVYLSCKGLGLSSSQLKTSKVVGQCAGGSGKWSYTKGKILSCEQAAKVLQSSM